MWILVEAAIAEAWTTCYVGNPQRSTRNRRCFGKGGSTQSVFVSHLPTDINGATSPSLSSQHRRHTVNGVECTEITIDLPIVGSVTILEATAEAQNVLVDLALTMNDTVVDSNQHPSTTSIPMVASFENIQLNVGDPYGAVLWPAASAVATRLLQLNNNDGSSLLANTVLERPLEGLTIIELGAGTGLISLAAIKAGAKKVIAVDYEPLPLQLLQFAAEHLNSGCQDKTNLLQCLVLDMEAQFTPLCQQLLDQADILVAADVLYQPSTGRALAKWIVQFLQSSTLASKRVLIGDSPGRPGRPVLLQELQRLGVSNPSFYGTVGRTCSGPRHELICGPNSQSVSESPKDLDVAILELKSSASSV